MTPSNSRPRRLDRRRLFRKALGIESLEPRKPLAVTVGLSGTVLSVSFDDTSDDAVIVTITPTGYSTTGANQSTGTGTVTRLEVTDGGGAKSSRFTLQSCAQTLTDGLSIDGNIDAAVIGGSIRTEGGPVSIAAKSTTISAAKIDAGVGQQTYGGSVSLQGGSPLGYSLKNLTVVGDAMFFAVGDGAQAGLWKTDGTTAGTVMVKSGTTLSSARNMIDVGGVLVFTASSPATGEELWRSDGTEAGTYMLRDFVPGSSSGFPLTFRSGGYEVAASDQTFSKVVLNNQMFFGLSGQYGTEPPYDDNGAFWRLWKTDGTVAGTVPVITVPTGNTLGAPGALAVVGNKVVFTAYSTSSGSELWVSDGTASGTQVLRDIRAGPASSSPKSFFPLDAQTLLFVANDGTGQELWKTDGTPSGTVRVKDINSTEGSDPSDLTAGPGGVYFSASDGLYGRELWKTDGSEFGTLRLADINPDSGSSNPVGLRAVGSKLYFTATNGTVGYELWKTDGTTSGTSLVKDIRGGSLPTSAWAGPFPLVSIGDTLYFTADDGMNGFELWTSDGTANGTSLVRDVRTGSGDAFTDDDPIVVAVVGNKLFFRVVVAKSPEITTFELWATDGTPTGTSRVLADRVNHFTPFKGEWYLFAGNVNARLCRLDSTTGDVVLVAEMASITLTGSTVSLGGGVSGTAHSLAIAGAAEIKGPVSGLSSLNVSGNALVGGSISTTGDQTFSQNLQLTADASLVAGHLHFGGTVDGANKQLTLLSISRSGTPPSAFTNVSVLSVSPPDVLPPQPPTAVQTTFGDTQVSLSWTAPTDDGGSTVTDYVVEFKETAETSWSTYYDGVSSATSATVTGLLNGKSYLFRVSAVNVIGSSSPSVPSAVTKPATLPGPPQYFTVQTVAGPGPGSMRLSWFWPYNNGGSEITDFVIESSADNGSTWTTVDDGVSISFEALVTGLLKGFTYAFRVSAVNGVGLGSPTSVIQWAPRATPPDKPTSVVALPAAGSATLSWSPPAFDGMNILDYVIEYSSDNGSTWRTFSDGTSTSTSATVSGLTNGTAYVFRVAAVNSAGTGDYSSPSIVIVPNQAPSDIGLSSTSVPENAGANAVVGTLTTTDPDASNTFTYTLVAGTGSTDNASFNISGNQLRATASLDFETKSSYSVRVRSTDQGGLFTEKTFTITVTDVNEAPTGVALTNTTPSLPENTSTTSRIKVADIVITDDALGTNTITLTGTDSGSFEVDGLVLYLKSGVLLDFETKQSYSVTVSVVDASLTGSTPVTTGFTLTLTDVNDLAPVFTSGTTGSVAENSAVTTPIYTAVTTDGDGTVANRSVTYSIKPGVDDAALVEILDPAMGVVTLKAQADFEAKPTYTFTVVATNVGTGATLVTEQAVTVTVTDVNEAPTDIGLSAAAIAENSALGTVIGTFTTTDPDAGDTFTYALVAGAGDADNAAFTINGELKVATRLNFELRDTYSIRVRATDAGGLTTEKAFTITVTDVADEPLVVERVTAPAPGAYRAGQRVTFTATLSEAVQVKRMPQIQVRAGTVTRTATFVSGGNSAVLTFQYTVGKTDNASAVAIGDKFVFANRSSITAGTEKLPVNLPAGIARAPAPGVRFDAAAPKVVGKVVVPGSGTYTVGQALDFVVRFSEAVIVGGVPQIGLTGLTAARQATYVSGSGTDLLTFRYVVQAGDALGRKKTLGLAKSITLPSGASITDEAGNRAAVKISAPSLKIVKIDTTTVATATLSAGGDTAFTTKRARAAAFATLG